MSVALKSPGDLLAAIYDLERPLLEWVGEVNRVVNRFANSGFGTVASIHDFSSPQMRHVIADVAEADDREVALQSKVVRDATFLLRDTQLPDAPSELDRRTLHLMTFDPSLPGWHNLRAQTLTPESKGLRARTATNHPYLDAFRQNGVADALTLVVPHRASRTVLGFAARSADVLAAGSDPGARWSKAHDHLSRIYDLRYRLLTGEFREHEFAWFSADGRCVAPGPTSRAPAARAELRARIRQHEQNRARHTGSSRTEVADYWDAVLDGRWAVLDHYDTDGRRYVVALPVSDVRDRFIALTQTERAVLLLAADGLSNYVISTELGVSETTISTHLHNIYKKLHVSGRTDAIMLVHAMRDTQRGGVET